MADAEFTIEIKGLEGLKRALKNYPRIATPIIQRALTASQAILAKNSIKDNPVPWRTGNLLQSFRFRVGNLEARWFPTAYYAPFVEFGTRRQRAHPFMAQIADKARPEIGKLFKEAGDIINREISKEVKKR